MTMRRNFCCLNVKRELDERYRYQIQDNFTVTNENIRKLGLYAELEGHTGCVNCIQFSESGQILASGSDDVHINIWDPLRKKLLTSLPSGHHGNIFSVKFVPNSRDRHIISGAADHIVRVHDLNAKEVLSVCSCHLGRVKRIVTDAAVPHLFWSSAEDGVILQHDLRTSHTCSTSSTKRRSNALIDLKSYCGPKAEAKCLAINPVNSDYIAVGANDCWVRLYDRRMIKMVNGSLPERIPLDAVQYFVPGHLPTKMAEFKRTYRSIASTYVAFSPNGKELLVNLGGEQIYLFPLSHTLQEKPKTYNVPQVNNLPTESELTDKTSNGYVNGYNQKSSKFIQLPFPFQNKNENKNKASRLLPPHVEQIKAQANEAFERKKYTRAIHLYNEALKKYPNSAVLYGNRAAALLKRAWDGDVYVALKDCSRTLALDPGHYKASLRMCRCLYELNRLAEADSCLREFRLKFPSHAETSICRNLESELGRSLKAQEERKVSTSSSSSSSDSCSPATSTSSASSNTPRTQDSRGLTVAAEPLSRNYFLRLVSSDSSNSPTRENEDAEENEDDTVMSDNHGTNSSNNLSRNETTSEDGKKPSLQIYPEDELVFKANAVDFSTRFCGHCNTTTDIKEANFFGNFIVAGSDDGSFFIWDRDSSNIVRMIKGDKSIVNCLQPHPSTCLLATSGIESVVRIWTPQPDEAGTTNERSSEDIDDAATSNQKRMATNPGNFLNLFLNMGGSDDPNAEEEAQEATMQCNST